MIDPSKNLCKGHLDSPQDILASGWKTWDLTPRSRGVGGGGVGGGGGTQSCCKPAWQELHCNTTSTPDAVVSHTKQGTVSHEVHQRSTAPATQEASPVCICHHCYGSRWQTGHLKSLTLNSNPGRILRGCVPEPSYILLS